MIQKDSWSRVETNQNDTERFKDACTVETNQNGTERSMDPCTVVLIRMIQQDPWIHVGSNQDYTKISIDLWRNRSERYRKILYMYMDP
jgi:hypothetical protein